MRIGKEVLILNLDDVLPNRFQPRINFDEQAIMELTESIKEHGVIQPIVVRRVADKYEIIAGERRYKASVLAGKKSIPAILADLNDRDSAEVALIENVQRQDLTPIEEAISYKKILDMGYLNQVDLANKLGKKQSTIANKLRLLNLCDEVQEALLKEKISERHARSLLKLDKEQQKIMLSKIISERLTVRKTDEEIEKMLNNNDSDNESTQKIKEEKEEKEMINDNNNNSQYINNFKPETSPIFPGFTTTNIEESQPINFGVNNAQTQTQPSTVIQEQPFENNLFEKNILESNSMNINNSIDNGENNSSQQDFRDIFGSAPSSLQPEEQPIMQQNFNNIFGSAPSPIQPEGQSTEIFKENNIPTMTEEQKITTGDISVSSINQGQQNKFFGLFNDDNVQPTQSIEPENLNVESNMPIYNDSISSNNVENSFNNNLVKNNNIFDSNYSNEESNIFPDIKSPENSESLINQIETPQVEELNFNEEIKPIEPVALNDNQQFNIQNSQILSQSPTPVAIITPQEIPELQPVMPEKVEEKIGTINDMIRIIRDAMEEVESSGYKIDSDEMDLPNSYQIIINIEK